MNQTKQLQKLIDNRRLLPKFSLLPDIQEAIAVTVEIIVEDLKSLTEPESQVEQGEIIEITKDEALTICGWADCVENEFGSFSKDYSQESIILKDKLEKFTD
jgi:hypothetical protein